MVTKACQEIEEVEIDIKMSFSVNGALPHPVAVDRPRPEDSNAFQTESLDEGQKEEVFGAQDSGLHGTEEPVVGDPDSGPEGPKEPLGGAPDSGIHGKEEPGVGAPDSGLHGTAEPVVGAMDPGLPADLPE